MLLKSFSLPANWWLQYLGKPWQARPCPPHSYNCGELVRSVYKDLCGIDSALIPVSDANSRLACARAMRPELFDLWPLPENCQPQDLDVVFMGRQSLLGHCGMAVNTSEGLKILHCLQTPCGVVLEGTQELRLTGFNKMRWFRHRYFLDKD